MKRLPPALWFLVWRLFRAADDAREALNPGPLIDAVRVREMPERCL